MSSNVLARLSEHSVHSAAALQVIRRNGALVEFNAEKISLALTKAFLATCRFHGRFWIASEPEVGTRIRIDLPFPDVSGN